MPQAAAVPWDDGAVAGDSAVRFRLDEGPVTVVSRYERRLGHAAPSALTSGQGLTAGDQREGRGRRLAGGGVRCLFAGPEGAVEEQRGVPVGRGHDGRHEPGRRGLVAAVQVGRRGQEQRADGLGGARDLRVAVLVEPASGQRLEKRALLIGETDVGVGGGGQPLRRRPRTRPPGRAAR